MVPPPPTPPDMEALLSQIGWVRNLARTLVGESQADDLAQETMLKALEAPPKHGANIQGWLATIARNLRNATSRSDTRRQARHEKVSRRKQVPPTPDQMFAVAEASRLVQDAIQDLDDDYRFLIMLRYYGGQSPAEIAEAQGTTSNAVRSKLSRATAKLGEILRRKYGEQGLVPCLILMAPIGGPGSTVGTATLTGVGLGWLMSWQAIAAALIMLLATILFWPEGIPATPGPETPLVKGNQLAASVAQEPDSGKVPSGRHAVTSADSGRLFSQVIVQTVDPRGLPVVDARVVAWPSQTPPLLSRLFPDQDSGLTHALAVATSDEQGLAVLNLPTESPVLIQAGARLGAMASRRLTTPAEALHQSPTVTLALGPAGCIEGLVRGLDQAPVANATVVLEPDGQTPFRTLAPFQRAQSTEHGDFRLQAIPPGNYRILVQHPQFLPFVAGQLEVVAGEVLDLAVNLDPGEVAVGRVIDEAGDPIVDARVWSLAPPELIANDQRLPDQQPSARADSEGRVWVQGLPDDGSGRLLVTAPGFQDQLLTEVDPTVVLEIQLQRCLDWTLVLNDSHQHPVSGAVVHLIQHRDQGQGTRRQLQTDAAGRATFERLCRGRYEAFVIHDSGVLHLQPFLLDRAGGMSEHELQPGARIHVSAHNSAGEALSGLSLRMISLEEAEGSERPLSPLPPLTARLDTLGEATLTTFPGRWQLFLMGPGVATQQLEIDLVAGRTEQRQWILDPPASLDLTLANAQGLALPRLRVALMSVSENSSGRGVGSPLFNADDEGRLRVSRLDAGRFALFAWSGLRPEHIPADAFLFEVTPGQLLQEEVQLSNVSQTKLSLSRHGLPVAEARLGLTWSEDVTPGRSAARVRLPATDSDGTVALPPLRTGRYFLQIQAGLDQPAHRIAVELASGISELSLDLRGARVLGRLSFQGSPFASAQVALLALPEAGAAPAIGAEEHALVLSDENGHFAFPYVPEGRWQLHLLDAAIAWPVGDPIVTDGVEDLDLGTRTLLPACRVEGRIEGERPTSATVLATHLASGVQRTLLLDSEGRFGASDLAPGEWQFECAGHESVIWDITLGGAQTVVLR